MTSFTADTYQNMYLAVGGTQVDAVVRVRATGTDGSAGGAAAAEVILIDVSGSMNYPRSKIRSARAATAAAIDCIRDGVHFGVVAGTEVAEEIYPGEGGLVPASDVTRSEARGAVNGLKAGGGTAIGQWLTRANALFEGHPHAIHHAILLTDGQNQDETPEELDATLAECAGRFQCDCRGVGADWEVGELREIASRLLGDVGLIREPEQMTGDFTDLMRRAMGRAVNDVALRLWTPNGAHVRFVKQVEPETEDITARRGDVSEREGDYPTGAWGDETRDYHVCIEVPARAVGDRMLACRLKLVVDDEEVSEAKILAEWTDDEALSTQLNQQVVAASGYTDYAQLAQEGVAALREGDTDTATNKLGAAVKIAHALRDEKKLDELSLVVDIEDAATGKVQPKKKLDELDLMEVDAESTKTVRRPRPAS
ncbi:MAG TPA: vWA domain-containing protein [Acidimicrobiia bacterium]|nr:vWA domain-containing protein [Acidimicrobiia bacterium]